jgi:hypothetical protein
VIGPAADLGTALRLEEAPASMRHAISSHDFQRANILRRASPFSFQRAIVIQATLVLGLDLAGVAQQLTDILPDGLVQVINAKLLGLAEGMAAETTRVATDASILRMYNHCAVGQLLPCAMKDS